MDSISYTAARANLARTMDRVCDDHEPVIITRSSEPSVVMISLEDYKALEETAYLLRSPKNARRLLESIADLATKAGAQFFVDNTFATPVLCRPLEHGAAFVQESLTKFIGGHSDLTLGFVGGRDANAGADSRRW